MRRLEVGLRLGSRAGVPQRERELVVRLWVVFRQADGLAELFNPSAIVTGFDLPHSDADRERRCLRVGRSAIEAVGFRQL